MLPKKRSKKHKPLIAKAKKILAPTLSGLPSSLKGIFAQDEEKIIRVRVKPSHGFDVLDPFIKPETSTMEDESHSSDSESSSESDSKSTERKKCDFLRSDDEDEDDDIIFTPEFQESEDKDEKQRPNTPEEEEREEYL